MNSQSFDIKGLLSKIAGQVCKESGLTGETLYPTLQDIQDTAIQVPQKDNIAVFSNGHHYSIVVLPEGKQGEWKTPVEGYDDFHAHFPHSEGAISFDREFKYISITKLDQRDIEPFFLFISSHIIRTAGEPSEKQAKWLHTTWKEAHAKAKSKIDHPFHSVVSEWIKTQIATPITTEKDQRSPLAVLKHPLGNVRELAFTENDTGQVFKTPERLEQIQMNLDIGEEASVLPSIMPLQVVKTAIMKPKTKAGAVSHELRIFFEAMMALKPSQRRADLMFRLGDLIGFLYPNGKFNWTNQMPHIKRALEVLHTYATVPWVDDQGKLREWRPVAVRSPLIDEAIRDTPIFIEVQMPPDAKRGHMVIKNIHRHIGMRSAAQWNAYHVAAYLWDKYGTVKGKLVDPTRPIEIRDDQNRLVGPNGKPLVTRAGKEIKTPYHTEAIAQLEREPNTDAIQRYPVLTNEDLIVACYPNGYLKRNRREYLSRAKKHWQRLQDDGHIYIHKERDGWRILPSAEHLKAHRALRKSTENVY